MPVHEVNDLEDIERCVAIGAMIYGLLVCLAFYADHKIQLRRARKKREREERERGST